MPVGAISSAVSSGSSLNWLLSLGNPGLSTKTVDNLVHEFRMIRLSGLEYGTFVKLVNF